MYDPEVPAGYQDADIELAEMNAAADEAAADEAAVPEGRRTFDPREAWRNY